MEQNHNVARRATPDEIRRQPEYQYMTSWAAPPNLLTNKRGCQRPHTAGPKSPLIRTRPNAFSGDGFNNNMPMRLGNARVEKGILRLRPSTALTRHERQLRRYSVGSLPPEAEESVYKHIAHLFETDAFGSKTLESVSSSHNDDNSMRQQSQPKKKAIRFVNASGKPNKSMVERTAPVIGLNSDCNNQKSVEINLDYGKLQGIDKKYESVSPNEENPSFNTNCKKAKCDINFKSEHEFQSFFKRFSETNFALSSNKKSNENFRNKDNALLTNTPASGSTYDAANENPSNICNEFNKLSINPKQEDTLSDQIRSNAHSDCCMHGSIQDDKSNACRRKPQQTKHAERSCSNYDADLEKCDKYLRAQSHSFTQTSQYMSNTKRGLSHLSMHYSQTNTAHNDRVIMSDLLKNGHTRNALIGDGVYSIERRLYNRRRDPMKSTTFYDRFLSKAGCKSAQPARKQKSRTVADRAKERQERINKKKEELERGFPPRAWSLVEVGADEIEHMLSTCRYLRVDIRKQPNVYGAVDLSDNTQDKKVN